MPDAITGTASEYEYEYKDENEDEDEDENETETDPQIEAMRERIVERATRCLHHMLVAIGRDHQRCGKAACARSRRCRGTACDVTADADGDTAACE